MSHFVKDFKGNSSKPHVFVLNKKVKSAKSRPVRSANKPDFCFFGLVLLFIRPLVGSFLGQSL